jgi:hypothetical protein
MSNDDIRESFETADVVHYVLLGVACTLLMLFSTIVALLLMVL